MMIRTLRLSKGQKERLSEIFGNVAVAWFSVGVITPLFIPLGTVDLTLALVVSFTMTISFTTLSLTLIEG